MLSALGAAAGVATAVAGMRVLAAIIGRPMAGADRPRSIPAVLVFTLVAGRVDLDRLWRGARDLGRCAEISARG